MGQWLTVTDNSLNLRMSLCKPIIVVGQEELDSRSVNVRNRDDVGTKAKTEMVPLDEIAKKLVELRNSRSLKNQFV